MDFFIVIIRKMFSTVFIYLSFQYMLYYYVMCEGNVIPTQETTKNSVTKFLNILKNDLRRNNDDYSDLNNTDNQTTTKLYTISTRSDKNNGNVIKKIFTPKDNLNATSLPNRNALINENRRTYKRKGYKKTNFKVAPLSTETNQIETPNVKLVSDTKPSVNRIKIIDKDKATKLLEFVNKNKQLMKAYINEKGGTTTKRPRVEIKRARNNMDSEFEFPYKKLTVNPDLEALLSLQNLATSEETKTEYVPTGLGPAEMDMAPAIGTRVYNLRGKGRLCQRSVLIPEGPKYNSKGEIYLKAYSPIFGKDYPQTKHPKFILPRCCNCCSKAAIGCE